MVEIAKQKILKIADRNRTEKTPDFITEDVVEVSRARLTYYKWINRFMALLATISLTYGVCATLVLFKIVPQIIVDPQIFVQFSDSTSLVKREYIHQRMDSRARIMINFMKQYVELRNTYMSDTEEMKKRWLWGGLLSYLSSYQVYQDFAKEYPKISQELNKMKASRSVEILSVERTDRKKSYTWNIEFKTYDYTYRGDEDYRKMNKIYGPDIIERYWTASIGAKFDPHRRTSYKRLINPLGFVVYKYSQDEIKR